MEVTYIYCNNCGYEYEGDGLFVPFVRSTADSDYYSCPSCKAETWNVIKDDD